MNLTAKQTEIVRRVSDGQKQAAIGEEMGISHKTVEWHLRVIRQKCRIGSSIAELVRFAIRSGIVTCLALSCFANPIVPSSVVPTPDTNTFDVHLAWDRSPSPEAIGYRVYYGTNAMKYSSSVLAGNSTNLTLPGLVASSQWYFAATAYDTNGFESDFSNQVTMPAPGKTNLWIQWAWQFADTISGPWVDQPGSIINYTNPTGQRFSRIRRTETKF